MRQSTIRRALPLLTCCCLLLGLVAPSLASGDRTVGNRADEPHFKRGLKKESGKRAKRCRGLKGKRRANCARHTKQPVPAADQTQGPPRDAPANDELEVDEEAAAWWDEESPVEDGTGFPDEEEFGEGSFETSEDATEVVAQKSRPATDVVQTEALTSVIPPRWPRPTLVNPTTITLGNRYTLTKLDPRKDYIVRLPSTKKVGGTVLVGGHNILIVGGSITVPTGTKTDTERRAIYIKEATGTVHIEGVSIDGSGGGYFDGVAIAAPAATVQLQNMRIVGVKGGYETFHGDVVQPWGGVKALRIDRLTGMSNYQGLMLQPQLGPIGSVELSNVDLTSTESSEPAKLAGGHMLWLTKGSNTCTGYPTRLSEVYVRPRAGRPLGTSVWPPTNSPLACKAQVDTVATWPNLPVTGGVSLGSSTLEGFVPAATVGLQYK